ncbi:MAG: sodium:solute symporter [Solirubrobacteraceae bacterium]
MVGALDYIVIVVYFAVMLGAAYWGWRRARTADDYLVAGRRLGHPMFVGTLSAVVLGGASTVGTVSLGYQYGLSGAALVFMIGLGLIGLGVLLARRLAHAGVYTVPELMAKRYGVPSRLVSAAIMAAYALMIAVTSTIASGTVFNSLLDVSTTGAILIAGGVVVLYCVTGGMWSLTLTDIIQFAIMTVGIFALLLPFAVSDAGGLGGMGDALPSSFFDPTAIGWNTIFTYFLLFFFGLMIGQDIWQRIFTGRDEKVIRRGTIVAGVYCIVYGIVGALIGAAAAVVLPQLGNPDEAFSAIVEAVLPTGVIGLVLAAALAAIMSTASAALLASSTILANDLLTLVRDVPNRMLATRVTTLLVGAGVVTVSLILNDVVGALTVAYDLLTGALFVPIVLGLLWPRGTGRAAVTSMAVSSVVVVVMMIVSGLYSNDPIIYGLLASLVVYVGVSLAGSPRPVATKPVSA